MEPAIALAIDVDDLMAVCEQSHSLLEIRLTRY
jgi:hypothetical protein